MAHSLIPRFYYSSIGARPPAGTRGRIHIDENTGDLSYDPGGSAPAWRSIGSGGGGGGAGLHEFIDMRTAYPAIKGDGVTDDAAAINAAFLDILTNIILNNPGFVGVTAYFGPGVYVVGSPINAIGGINIVGAGTGQTVFSKKAGTGVDVIRSYDWLVGTVRQGGVLLQDFTVHGNYGAGGADAVGSQTTGSGILWNGTFWLNRVVVRNCREYGIHMHQNPTDGTAFPPENPSMNYYRAQNFAVWNCYGIAHVHVSGGTDNQLGEFWIYNRDDTNPPNNVGLLLSSGGNKIIQGHFWSIESILTNIQVQSTAPNNLIANCVIESPKTGGESVLLNGPSQIRGCHLYCNPERAAKGIRLGANAGSSEILLNKIDEFRTAGIDMGPGPAQCKIIGNSYVSSHAAGAFLIGTIPAETVVKDNSTVVNGAVGGAHLKGELHRRPDDTWKRMSIDNANAWVANNTAPPNFQ